MKKLLYILLVFLLLLTSFPAFAEETESTSAWQAYNGKRIGVLTGPLMEDIAHRYFPDSEYMLFNSYPDCVSALLAGKIDAFLGDEPGMKSLHAEQPQIDYIRERLSENYYCFAFRKDDPKNTALLKELNEFIKRCWADGTMQELEDIWLGVNEDRKVVDMSDLAGANGTIRVVTTSTDMPYSYIKDGKNVGYDIDLIVRFCREKGYALELGDVDFAGRIPAVQSGKYDFSTDMNKTAEREEQVLFSEPVSSGGVVLAILSKDLSPEPTAAAEKSVTLEDLEDKRIGIPSGTNFDRIVRNRFPKAELMYFNNQSDLLTALAANKIDAFPSDEPVIRYIMNQRTDVTYIPDYLEGFDFAYCFAKTSEGRRLCEQFSEFIAGMKADGRMAALEAKWFSKDESIKTMPEIGTFSAENGVLRLATDGDYMPFEYIRDGQVVGYDIDIAAEFCQAYGYGLKIEVMNLDAVLPAVQSGKCSFGASAITITAERAESVLFCEPNYTGGAVMVVSRDKGNDPASATGFTSLSQLNGKRIGVQTGTTQEKMVLEFLPDAKLSYFNTYPDMVAALEAHKIDAFPGDEIAMRLIVSENDGLILLNESMDTMDTAFVLPKTEAGDKLRAQLNEWITSMKASGEMDKVFEKWTEGPVEERTVPAYDAFPAPNGVLTAATEGAFIPMNYYQDNQLVGIEIDLVARFCRDNGYGLRMEVMSFDGILAAVQTGKVDFAAAGVAITKERQESVNFSLPYYTGGTVMAVLKAQVPDTVVAAAETDVQQDGFWNSLVTSFRKTFIRESRWKLFLEGIGNTMLITILSILFGTLLGFLVFLLCRNGSIVANGATRFSMWLVQGMPMVVLLMILYYLIFGSIAISGIAVAVIGFTLTFGAAVFGLIKMGVGVIDRGQYEAAYALGHSRRHTFFRIILPQAIPHVLPAYQGEIVGLIKATAIVGYIAVQDLTKMGDIVRSRTYEAFFPLIAIAVIYFVLEGLFSFAVSRIRISVDTKRRKPDKILKGVKEHD